MHMKKSLLRSMLLFGLLALAAPVWALSIDGDFEVGPADGKIEETTQLNGDAADLAWVKSILGDDVSCVIKHENLAASDWKQTNQAGIWAFYLSDSPDYFLVKTGNNQANNLRTFLFANNNFKDWAVLDLGDIYVASITNIAKISYLSEFNATPTPEPGTILLLGSGILGLRLFGGKRRKA